ncbi:MAG: hypothetical protein EXQ87_13790 [Alphaproteobacteria bacterium]|nr:hypothetical protein [Alphaproteobacteria bacterium]
MSRLATQMLCYLLLALAGAWFGAARAEAEAPPPIRVEFADVEFGAGERAAMQAMVEREYRKVVAFLGTGPHSPIEMRVTDWYRGEAVRVTTAYSWRGLVVIPSRVFRMGVMPTAHEIAHVVAGHGANQVLVEGLAVHVHGRFGEQPAFPNFRMSVAAALAQSLSRVAADSSGGTVPASDALALSIVERELGAGRTLSMVDVGNWLNDLDQPQRRRAAYLMAGSFVGYVVEDVLKGDMAAFMRIYRSGDYAGVTGQSLARLEAAWRIKIAAGG